MNPVSTSVRAASGVITALKGQPLVLGLLVTNLTYIGLGGWVVHENNVRRQQIIDKLLATCLDRGDAK